MPRLLALPTQLLSYIFDYFPTVEVLRLCTPQAGGPVCKEFVEAVCAAAQFSVDCSVVSPKADANSLVLRARTFHTLQSLVVKHCRQGRLQDGTLDDVLRVHADSLAELTLAAVVASFKAIKCPNLISLHITDNKALSLPPLRGCPQLAELDLSRTSINDLDLQRALVDVTSIKTLRLRSCKNITLLPVRLEKLEFLDLSNTGVIDQAVLDVTVSSPRLRVLFLADCGNLHNVRLRSNSLLVLSLLNCWKLKTPVCECPNLRDMDLSRSNIGDVGLISILGHCASSLRTLQLRACYELANPEFDALPLVAFPHLTSLDVSMTSLTGSRLSELLARTPALQTLRMLQAQKIHDGLAFPALDDLTELVSQSTYLEDEAVVQILVRAPNIARLDLGNSVNIKGALLSSHKLMELKLSLTSADDDSVTSLPERCPNLRKLWLDRCMQLTTADLASASLQHLSLSFWRKGEHLSLNCPNLTSLDLSGPNQVQDVKFAPHSLRHLDLIHLVQAPLTLIHVVRAAVHAVNPKSTCRYSIGDSAPLKGKPFAPRVLRHDSEALSNIKEVVQDRQHMPVKVLDPRQPQVEVIEQKRHSAPRSPLRGPKLPQVVPDDTVEEKTAKSPDNSSTSSQHERKHRAPGNGNGNGSSGAEQDGGTGVIGDSIDKYVLEGRIEALQEQIKQAGLSKAAEPRVYFLKKQLAAQRALLLKENRRLQTQAHVVDQPQEGKEQA